MNNLLENIDNLKNFVLTEADIDSKVAKIQKKFSDTLKPLLGKTMSLGKLEKELQKLDKNTELDFFSSDIWTGVKADAHSVTVEGGTGDFNLMGATGWVNFEVTIDDFFGDEDEIEEYFDEDTDWDEALYEYISDGAIDSSVVVKINDIYYYITEIDDEEYEDSISVSGKSH